MRPQFSVSSILKNRTFATIALALIAILLVGLISVAGVALYGKITGRPAPAIPPSATAVKPAVITPQPTFTLPPTQQPTATQGVVHSPTPEATAVPVTPGATPDAMPTASPMPTATPAGDEGMPDTGGSLWQVALAGGGLAAVAALARSGRRKSS